MKRPEYVEISLQGQIFRIRFPKRIPMNRINLFIEYERLKKRAELENLLRWSDRYGRVHVLPMSESSIKKYSVGLSDSQIEKLRRKDKEAREIKSQLRVMKLKLEGNNYIYNNVSEESRSVQLMNEWSTQILELLGKGFTSAEVHKELLGKGVDIRYQDIQTFHINNRAKIAEMRSSYNEDIKDVSLYSKRSRLEKLSYLLNEIMDDMGNATTPLTRQKISAESRAIIEQARREVEGEEIKLTVQGKIDVDATINMAAATMGIGEGLTIAQIVIARVAARLGLRSQYFIDHLATSYYAKYSGFRRNDDLKTKPLYPTAVAYDIMDVGMEQKNQEWQKNQQSYEIDDQTESPEEKDSAAKKKEEMRMRLIKLLEKK